MYRSILLACSLIAIAACAESPTTPATNEPAEIAATTPESAASSKGVIEVVDVPNAPEAAVVVLPQPATTRICRRERRTGTNRTMRVCRTRAEIEQKEIESKDTFEELRRSQQEYGRQD